MLSNTTASHDRSARARSSVRAISAELRCDTMGSRDSSRRAADFGLLVGKAPVDAARIERCLRIFRPGQADHSERGSGAASRFDQAFGVDELAVGRRFRIGKGEPQALHRDLPAHGHTMWSDLSRRQ